MTNLKQFEMKRHFWAFMAIVCLLAVQNTQGQQMVPAQKISATPAAGAQMTLAQADGIAFRELSFPEALKRAEVEDKLLFVDCFTTWCGPCKRLSKVVFKDSLVADYFNRHFVNLKMDMEKDEGVELRKKYGVHAYPTLLFINSSGEVVYRLVGAEDALELLKKVKLGVESGGLSGLKKRYEAGDRDLAFISGYINALSAANREQEAGQVAADFLQGREQKMLEDEDYFLVFYYYVHDVNSSAFQYVVNHQKEIADKFPRQGASLDRRLLEDWIAGSYAYLKVDESNHCTFDEQGLDAYVAKMKQMNVAEADMIGESLRLSRDGIMKQWDSFVKRGDKILASHTILGDEGHLLQWVNWLNKECADMSLREKAAQWCDKACEELIKKNEEIKKNLPPGAIPAISMVDHKGQLLQVAEKLRKLMQQS
ncbi:thioredoxin family protein [Bacteroides thetaiotaomicron]|jgi:thiol-disulfide isomerase/thioredoxin